MYQEMIKNVQEKMKPFNTAVEINKTAAEKLFTLRSEYVSELFSSGLSQMQAFAEIKAPKDAFELQMNYFKSLDAKLVNAAEQEIAALVEAKERLSALAEESLSNLAEAPLLQNTAQIFQATSNDTAADTKATTKTANKAPARAARKTTSA